MYISFFQAADVIRYTSVTGVQTCALPISRIVRYPNSPQRCRSNDRRSLAPRIREKHHHQPSARYLSRAKPAGGISRSEERRVGEEGEEWVWGWACDVK